MGKGSHGHVTPLLGNPYAKAQAGARHVQATGISEVGKYRSLRIELEKIVK